MKTLFLSALVSLALLSGCNKTTDPAPVAEQPFALLPGVWHEAATGNVLTIEARDYTLKDTHGVVVNQGGFLMAGECLRQANNITLGMTRVADSQPMRQVYTVDNLTDSRLTWGPSDATTATTYSR